MTDTKTDPDSMLAPGIVPEHPVSDTAHNRTKAHQAGFLYSDLGLDTPSIKRSITDHLIHSVGKDPYIATGRDWYHALAYAVRDRLIERWTKTMRAHQNQDAKRVYYLSMEFLIGRLLGNSLINMGIRDESEAALLDLGLKLEALQEEENDAALGNGGLGRLAACYLDTMATLRLPGYGYGIRYEYGMFHQRIENGYQIEHPDNWLRYGNPWEYPRPEVLYPVRFYGKVIEFRDEHGRLCHHWVDTQQVMAMAYDTPIPGYATNTVNNLRLWSAKATRDFNLGYFNVGNYIQAVQEKNESENISRVLYPDDTTDMGRELRLKQEYFFVSASIQDIINRFRLQHDDWTIFPDRAAVQLNDTHPSIAIAELLRLLLDEYHLDWECAWDITRRTFSYTNHTLMPEALETWRVTLMQRVLPRHLQIIYEINHRLLKHIAHRFPGDVQRLRRMSLIDETQGRRVRMAHLAIVGSHRVNGVSAIHTRIMRTTLMADFDALEPDKIINITNGVTPRRWLLQINPALSALISSHIGRGWVTDLEQLTRLEKFATDAAFQTAFREVKHRNKCYLAALIQQHMGYTVDTNALFDVQIKRIHEYKRQLLNALHVVTLYNRMCDGEDLLASRVVIFAGKAAPGYYLAKLIIKLINDIAVVVNHDPRTRGRLQVVYIPNYDVSTAGDIIPAADLSEQISTAGTEASGTGNMKLALNGALTIGTLDGANVEIGKQVGEDNIFIFGHTAEQVVALQADGYAPREYYERDPMLRRVLDMIGSGYFSPAQPTRFHPILHRLLDEGDPYLVLADYAAYVDCQQRAAALYQDTADWTRRATLNVARLGMFSSDRAIREYAENIWHAQPVALD